MDKMVFNAKSCQQDIMLHLDMDMVGNLVWDLLVAGLDLLQLAKRVLFSHLNQPLQKLKQE
jgi:hypothetical protein